MALVTHRTLDRQGRVAKVQQGHSRPIRRLLQEPPRTDSRAVAAIVPCHGHGRFLAQCLQSIVREQRRPFAEVVVVDDLGLDETEAVARSFGNVRYVRVEPCPVTEARNVGLAETAAPLVVHVDADNWLGPTFLEELLAAMDSPEIAIAAAPPVEVDVLGSPVRKASYSRPFDYHALRRQNYIDTCCLVRRDAIMQAGGWRSPIAHLEDWHLWLRITQAGWRVQTLPDRFPWFYRLHDERMSTRHQQSPLEENAAIMQDALHLAVLTPFCGRTWALGRYAQVLRRIGWPKERLHGYFVDNSVGARFTGKLQEMLRRECGDWASVTIIRDPVQGVAEVSNERLANERWLREMNLVALVDATARVYAREAQRLIGQGIDLVLTIEDDVEPLGEEIAPRLLRWLAPDVMAVSGVVMSRFETDRCQQATMIAVQVDGEAPYEHRALPDNPDSTCHHRVGGTGMGCLLSRAEAWDRFLPRRYSVNDDGLCLWHDMAFAADVRRAGFGWVLDRSVRCRHWHDRRRYV